MIIKIWTLKKQAMKLNIRDIPLLTEVDLYGNFTKQESRKVFVWNLMVL